jgi:hypothetical protein
VHVRAVGIGAVQHDGIGVGACDGRESNRRHRLRLRPTTVPRTSLSRSWCFLLLAGSSCRTGSILVFQAGGVATADTHLTLQLPVIRGSYTSAGRHRTHRPLLYAAISAVVPELECTVVALMRVRPNGQVSRRDTARCMRNWLSANGPRRHCSPILGRSSQR